MRPGPLALAAVLLSPAVASAGPIQIGALFGEAQSETEATGPRGPTGAGPGHGADATYGAFARIGVTRQLAVQLEVSRIESDPTCDVRTISVLGVVDLGGGWARGLRSRVVPIVLIGAGEAWGSSPNIQGSSNGRDAVAGLGVEYRAANGFVLGFQARLGYRWMQTLVNYTNASVEEEGLYDGQYRSLLVTGGVIF
jgi:hypothetical protein